MRFRPARVLFFASLVAYPIAGAPRPARHGGPADIPADTLRLYYVGHPVGYERYSLTFTNDGYQLTDDFDYVDRGRRTHLSATTILGRDFVPRSLAITRLTDTSATVETRIRLDGAWADVVARGETTRVAIPPLTYPIAAHTPFAQQLGLVRYWLASAQPPTLAVVPGDPTNEVRVDWRGRDTLMVGSTRHVLERYSVEGVVWGTHSIWLDANQRLAAITTASGGGLSFDAVRLELDSLLPELQARAARDRMTDLTELSARVTPVAAGSVALVGATVIDGTGAAPLADATVLVRNGQIVRVGKRGRVTIPPAARTIDVRGKTIIPGLWDMHAHLMQADWGPVYIAAGVTTARDMGNVLPFILPFRETVHAGRGIGPRMLLAGLIDGGGPNAFGAINATTPQEGRTVVRRYHDLGFEQVKLYSLLKPDVVAAISREAHRLGMTVTGHVPTALTLRAAIDSGMDHIAHLPVRGIASSDSVAATIAFLKVHGTVIDPTASWGELLQHSTAEPVANFQPVVDRLPPVLRQRIVRMGVASVDTATAHARLANTLAILRRLHEAGVPIVAGTDEGVPGWSVHREVELYVKAGIPPMDALRMATAIPAKAMGLDGSIGTLRPGMRADLVVLDSNPLDDIANLRRVQLVMSRGRLYRSAEVWRAAGFR
jgi:imidazolonepropionase-like amidohydrolase